MVDSDVCFTLTFSLSSCLLLKLSGLTLVQHTREHPNRSWHSRTLIYIFSSCVGVWQNDRVEIIANDQGNRTTPSYVSFSDNERLIGDAAKNQVAMNPHNTYVCIPPSLTCLYPLFRSVFDAKRLIGRKFDDPEVQADIKHYPFKVFSKGGKPYVQVEYRGERKEFV